jgi:hypothetical protein
MVISGNFGRHGIAKCRGYWDCGLLWLVNNYI